METVEKTTVEVLNPTEHQSILTAEALTFLSLLHQKFNLKRIELLKYRETQQEVFDQGFSPKFPKETESVRNSVWTAAPIPEKLLDRRVEITGPVDRKMVINALNSGAKIFMADFEDSCSPTFENLMEGQQNLIEAIRKTITLELNGKTYKLNKDTATLLVRPRGLHLEDKNLICNEENLSGSLVDFGLYFFHNVVELQKQNLGIYLYLPKIEHYTEARWWNEVFEFSQNYFKVPIGTVKATVLIETITASFPTLTNFFSSAFLLMAFLYTSSEKIVAMLFAFPASDATIAAVNAANASPFKPVGNKFSKEGYALFTSTMPFESSISVWNIPFWYNT